MERKSNEEVDEDNFNSTVKEAQAQVNEVIPDASASLTESVSLVTALSLFDSSPRTGTVHCRLGKIKILATLWYPQITTH